MLSDCIMNDLKGGLLCGVFLGGENGKLDVCTAEMPSNRERAFHVVVEALGKGLAWNWEETTDV